MSDSVVVQSVGEIVDSAREYARRQIAAFVRRLQIRQQGQSLSARVKLTVSTRSSMRLPVLAQANLDIGGQPVRAQVIAAFVHEASRALRARLGEQLARLANPDLPRPWPAAQGVALEFGGTVPVGQREIVRHKSYPLARCTPDQATQTMDVMDYDCHLFIDADTGLDSLIHRVGPTGYRLTRLVPLPPPPALATPLTIEPRPAPELTAEEAVTRLDATELPYRFFRDRTTGRGAVLYRRHDGHYGLITTDGTSGER